jgi:glutathionylspermidine synthase
MNKEKVIEILINDFGWVSIEKGDDLVIEMMQDTIEATKKAFSLTDVSQQRGLLKVLEYTRQIKNNPKEIQLLIDKMYVDNL